MKTKEGYELIPMSEITDEAREIAVAWMECEDKNWIGQKHKLASDIMNYAKKYHAQFTQPITDEEIEGAYYDSYGKMDCTDIRKFRFIRGAKWAIERMKKGDRELLVEFGIYLDNNTNRYIFEDDIDKFLNSNK